MSAGGISYDCLSTSRKVTLPSVESWGTNMNIIKDPTKGVYTRRIDKVGDTQDILLAQEDSGDRIAEYINVYARGVNPMVSVSYDNYGKNGGTFAKQNVKLPYKPEVFYPPVFTQENITPLSRLPRNWTYALTNPEMPGIIQEMKCPSGKSAIQTMNPQFATITNPQYQKELPHDANEYAQPQVHDSIMHCDVNAPHSQSTQGSHMDVMESNNAKVNQNKLIYEAFTNKKSNVKKYNTGLKKTKTGTLRKEVPRYKGGGGEFTISNLSEISDFIKGRHIYFRKDAYDDDKIDELREMIKTYGEVIRKLKILSKLANNEISLYISRIKEIEKHSENTQIKIRTTQDNQASIQKEKEELEEQYKNYIKKVKEEFENSEISAKDNKQSGIVTAFRSKNQNKKIISENNMSQKLMAYLEDFLISIDNLNAASAVGTLEFLDKMAKLNTVSTICNFNNDKINQEELRKKIGYDLKDLYSSNESND